MFPAQRCLVRRVLAVQQRKRHRRESCRRPPVMTRRGRTEGCVADSRTWGGDERRGLFSTCQPSSPFALERSAAKHGIKYTWKAHFHHFSSLSSTSQYYANAKACAESFEKKQVNKAIIPMHIARFIFCVRACVCARRPLALISNGGTLRGALCASEPPPTQRGNACVYSVNILSSHAQSLPPSEVSWKKVRCRESGKSPCPAMQGESPKVSSKSAVLVSVRTSDNMCVCSCFYSSFFPHVRSCQTTAVCTDSGIVPFCFFYFFFLTSPTPASFWGNCHENHIYISILTGGVLIEQKKLFYSKLLSVFCSI